MTELLFLLTIGSAIAVLALTYPGICPKGGFHQPGWHDRDYRRCRKCGRMV